MKILVTGAAGYVGTIARAHLSRFHEVRGADLAALPEHSILGCNLCNLDEVSRLGRQVSPDLVVHAAGNKNIDFCEKYPDAAFRINCEAVKNVAQVFGARCSIVYISTDYVFDGSRGMYGEEDTPVPLTVYGKSKLCGEEEGVSQAGNNFITLRLSALFDLNATFPRFLHERLSHKETVECFSDVIYSPTYYGDFLTALDRIIAEPFLHTRTLHVCGSAISRFGFACAFARVFGHNVSLVQNTFAVGKGSYLFPNLSLQNIKSQKVLRMKMTDVEDALQELKKGIRS
jgi:dTDP-4-dehydrorhamnose reductase